MKKFICIMAMFLGLGLFLNAQNAAEADPDIEYAAALLKAGTKAPDFKIATPDGKQLKLSSFKGKIVVLDFWASWCPDCRKELPAIEAAYEKYSKKGVVFIGVSFDDSKEKWTKAISDFGLKYPQVSELKKWKETEISPVYSIKWIPTLYVIDRKGKVALGTVVTEKMLSKLEELTK
ncbi:MAG: TlpA family protein disulfide reductase [Bacteroidales bacterium]|nr:TlpA family protein disulfide reductase [Candidatus Cryptobacteroides faecihippi]MCQ2161971.1 TlpA family protein disulfide reductase [Bacteroidales bacterium]